MDVYIYAYICLGKCIHMEFINVGTYLGLVFKACVRYFLSNFYFSPSDSPSKKTQNVFYFI